MGRGEAVRLSWLQGLASSDHTTLLLNCYTKLKDVEKLDEFLKASGATEDQPSLHFDVETAIKVGHLNKSFTCTFASPPNSSAGSGAYAEASGKQTPDGVRPHCRSVGLPAISSTRCTWRKRLSSRRCTWTS